MRTHKPTSDSEIAQSPIAELQMKVGPQQRLRPLAWSEQGALPSTIQRPMASASDQLHRVPVPVLRSWAARSSTQSSDSPNHVAPAAPGTTEACGGWNAREGVRQFGSCSGTLA